MTRYAGNNLDAYQRPPCQRCGATSVCDFYEATKFADPAPMYRPNRHWCETPGCVDEQGYNTVNSEGA